MLDEVMDGLNPAEISGAMELIRKVRDSGKTVLMIEHHMKAVVGVCELVMVLNFGTKIAEGQTRDVLTNPQVSRPTWETTKSCIRREPGMLEAAAIDLVDVQALWGVSFTVKEREIVTLIGANSAGKSSSLRTIAGTAPPRSGQRFCSEALQSQGCLRTSWSRGESR